MKGVIFDLDQTLVDSRIAEPFRRLGQWGYVYQLIPKFHAYPGIADLIEYLHHGGIRMCIVTSAPSNYCRRVLKHYRWPIERMVCYHDTRRHKPDPAPMFQGLYELDLAADHVITVGDAGADIKSSHSAGIRAIGALWGSLEGENLMASAPNRLCNNVQELAVCLGAAEKNNFPEIKESCQGKQRLLS